MDRKRKRGVEERGRKKEERDLDVYRDVCDDDGKREEEEQEQEQVVNRSESEKEEDKKKRFECGVCFELMNWEKEPRMLPCCGLSFCSPCLNKLFLLQNPSSSPSSLQNPSTSSSSSSSSSSLPSLSEKKGVKCPVCRKVNECETIELLEMNYLIPETIDILLSSSSNPFSHSFSNCSDGEMECANFELCGERTRMFCPNCQMFICDSCDPSHTSTLFSRNHKREQRNNTNVLRDSDDGSDDGKLKKKKKKECSNHPSELVCGYCFECSLFVCVRCVLDTHAIHDEKVKSIEESVLKKRNEVVKIGDRFKRRLIFIEKKKKKIEEEMKELEETLERKRVEKKEIELEKEDLRIRQDSIIRLSNTPTDISLFDDQLFSTLLQTANDIVSEEVEALLLSKPKKGAICCDGSDRFRYVSSIKGPYGVGVNSDGNIFISELKGGLRVTDKEGNVVQPIQTAIESLHLEPIDVSIGLNDQIVLLDWYRERFRVVVLNKKGELIKSFGSRGSEPGQFAQPFGIDVDREGNIIVGDTYNHRIQVFDNDGSFVRSFGSFGSSEDQLNKPYRVTVDGEGNIVICDGLNHRIKVVDIEGNFIRCFGTEGPGESQLGDPRGVDVDGEGRIVVSELGNERVSVFEKDGTFLFSFGKGRMRKPRGVVVDPSGSILVSDWEKRSIELWN